MKYKYLFLILLVPIAVFAATLGNIKNNAIVTGSGGKNYNPNKVLTTAADRKNLGLDNALAKQFLKSRYSRATMNNGCAKNKDKAINGLDTKFAQCATRFLKQWEQQNGRVTITSAFRDANDQACVCKRTSNMCAKTWVGSDGKLKTGSRHAKGIAIDVTPADKSNRGRIKFYLAARAFGGVHFRLARISGGRLVGDRPHLEPNGGTCSSGDGGQGGKQGGYQPSGGGALSGGGQEQKPPSGEKAPQAPKPPSGGSGGAQAGDSKNPYSRAGQSSDPYSIWKDPRTGEVVENTARITCDPGTIAGTTERALIEWSCGGQSSRSRGGTTRLQSRFNTKGRLTGRGYTRPRESTSYKIQCLDGDKVIGAAVCRVNVDVARTGAVTGDATRAVLHLSTSEPSVEWGGSTSLQWATIGASNCKVRGGRIREDRGGGSADTGRLYRPTVYILQCDTSNGSKLVKTEVKIR